MRLELQSCASLHPATPDAAISVNGVSHVFKTRSGPVEALRDCSMDVAPGSFGCLVGPSGCGKSTLLDMIAQLLVPQTGRVSLHSGSGEPPRLAMVFQKPALFPWRTVEGNVTIGLRARNVSRPEAAERTRAVLAAVGLTKFARAYPHELSGGMAQRVGIARALALEPDILLMDEPFAAVDAQTRIVLQRELLALVARTGTTTLFVTHDVAEAVYLGDRLIIMSGRPGRVLRTIDLAPEAKDRASPYFARTAAEILDLLAPTHV